jgi:hypothetical protein
MDPITLFAVATVASAGATAFAGQAEAMSDAARQESEARLADTQALQRDTQARDDLRRTISTIRSSRAANGLSARSPNARLLESETRRVADNERLVQVADYRQRAANMRAAAKSSRRRGKFSLLTGFTKAGTSIAQTQL